MDEPNFQHEEISITLPCGIIVGKWWGPKDIRPILCLHGWQDNAGTFDRIIPLLPKHVSYLAIDYPGHGLSYRNPSGIVYNFNDFTFMIRLIAELYKWKKVSLLAHSMGTLSAFIYAGLFADDVDLVIILDSIEPPCKPSEEIFGIMKKGFDSYVKFEKGISSGKEPPSYPYDEIERMVIRGSVTGSSNSVTPETVPYLLERGLAKSKLDPSKYYFTRDVRVKNGPHRPFNNDFAKYLIQHMRMPYLYIKASESDYFEPKEIHDGTLDELRKCNPNFVYQMVDGHHHVHLTHPERVSGFITDIILRARPIGSEKDTVNINFYINCKL